MTPQEVAEALIAWADETVDLETTYDHDPARKKGRFPDAAAIITEIAYADKPANPGFPLQQLEQTRSRLYTCQLLLMVDPKDEDAASSTLNDFAHRLGEAADADPTLGARVESIGSSFNFNFTPPFVKYDDGTEGRQVTMHLVVAESLAA